MLQARILAIHFVRHCFRDIEAAVRSTGVQQHIGSYSFLLSFLAGIAATYSKSIANTDTMAKLGAPLKCWDIFIEAYGRSMDDARDLAAIRRLGILCDWGVIPDIHHKLIKEQKGIIVTDLQEQIVFSSKNIYLMTGRAPEQLIGSNMAWFRELDETKSDCTLEIEPIFDTQGQHTHFMVFLKKEWSSKMF